MRHKNRYFLVKVEFEEILESMVKHVITTCLRSQIQEIYGLIGLAKSTSLTIKYYSPITCLMIMRCSLEFHREILACLAVITKIRDHSVRLSVIHVSGTIVKIQKKVIDMDRKAIQELLMSKKLSQKRCTSVGSKNMLELEALAD
jgi:RNase P/RNase MRP subunit POP5